MKIRPCLLICLALCFALAGSLDLSSSSAAALGDKPGTIEWSEGKGKDKYPLATGNAFGGEIEAKAVLKLKKGWSIQNVQARVVDDKKIPLLPYPLKIVESKGERHVVFGKIGPLPVQDNGKYIIFHVTVEAVLIGPAGEKKTIKSEKRESKSAN